jgi:ABC-2 type transport system permease protein
MIERVRAIWDKRFVLATLVRRDLRVRYAQSFLGYVWTVLDPLLMALVYFVVFTYVFKAHRAGLQPYLLFLIIGMLAWQWFNGTVGDTTRSLQQEARLVRSTNLPREIWVIRVVVAKGIEYLLSLPVLAGFTLLYVVRGEAHLNWRLVLIPLAIAIQFVLLVGLGLLLAPIHVLATDTERVVRILLRFMFYATPVLYSTAAVPEGMRILVELNPLSGILAVYRSGFFDVPFAWREVGVAVVESFILLVCGWVVFRRMERAVLKEI